jgi:large subunit ribosomal protein L21
MYAVIVTGGKQYKVAQGDRLRVEKIEAEVGDTVELDQVRLLSGDDGIVVDPKKLTSAKVIAEVVDRGKRKKIRVFKMKRRKNYARHYGHRQQFTEIKIQSIQA